MSSAVHETTSQHTDAMLDFLEEQSKNLQVSRVLRLNHLPSAMHPDLASTAYLSPIHFVTLANRAFRAGGPLPDAEVV